MHQIVRSLLRLGAALLMVAAVAFAGAAGGAGRALASPAAVSNVPASSAACTGTGTVTCDLWAKTGGSLTLPDGSTVAFWGYATSAGGAPQLPGPVLLANAGDTVTVNLHNALGRTTALLFPNQSLAPDTAGVANGSTKSYTFAASQPGTFLYQAGMIANGPRQVAMGLYGAMIVRPSASQAYTDLDTGSPAYNEAATAFDDEALLVYSEIDPAFSAAPDTFRLQNFKPKYLLINGAAYPTTSAISSNAGRKLLLRQVNAGIQNRSIGVLGLRQSVLAQDGSPLNYAYNVAAESLAGGEVLDTLVTIPASAPSGGRFALYDAALPISGSGGANALGGALTFIQVGTSTSPGDTQGPVASGLSLAPTFTNGSTAVSISVTSISDVSTGGSNVVAASYTIDGGAAQSLTLTGGGTPTASASGTISTAQLAALASGSHSVFVRGQDSAGNWGAAISASFALDKDGPATSALTLSPAVTNGTAAVAIAATLSDAAKGGSNVSAAEYFIDSQPAATTRGTALALNQTTAPTADATGTIAAATVNGLSAGSHTIAVRGKDAAGNWGAFAAATLVVDKAGPAVSGTPTVAPNPNNGTLNYNSVTNGVRVDATFTDALSSVANGEIFFNPASAPAASAYGTGIPMVATDSLFNAATEAAYGIIPSSQVQVLAAGTYTNYIHGKDAAGNWGAFTTTTLRIDKTAPTMSGSVTLTPSATNNTAVAISASASDVATGNSNIAAAEFFIDTVGANGTGTAMTVGAAAPSAALNGTIPAATVTALTAGTHTVYVHARDAAGNWSTTGSATLRVDRTPPTFSSITLSPNSIPAGTATINLTVNGSSDGTGGSGVAGGEYWFGTTDITAGTGTAFTGTSSVPIATGSLTAGTYTVRVRIRDAAGNWSTGTGGVRTATLTVTAAAPDAIFADGFELGNTSAWSGTSGTASVTSGAALVGTRGLQVAGGSTNYVRYTFGTSANPATTTFDARFYFNPNGHTGSGQDIFTARTAGGSTIFRVRYRLNGTIPEVQIQGNSSWFPIANGSNRIEVVLQASGSVDLYVGGTLAQTQTVTSNAVAEVRLGAVSSSGNSTLMYFDAFSAKRSVSPLIGP